MGEKEIKKMDEARLVKIEMKIEFQEQTIKELNDVICEQQNEIQRLAKICDLLSKQGKEFSEYTSRIDAPANEKPPHY
jgi:SlyX protein